MRGQKKQRSNESGRITCDSRTVIFMWCHTNLKVIRNHNLEIWNSRLPELQACWSQKHKSGKRVLYTETCKQSVVADQMVFRLHCWLKNRTLSRALMQKNKPNTGCPRRNGQNFGRVFLMLNYTDKTQNTYIQSWTVTEIMTIEKCGLLGYPRTVRRPWRHTRTLRMPGNETPLANIVMRDNGPAAACVKYLET